jgi:2-(1,2-epoxy-1,2-dihydrophenyl)acetyl-CoA isomerase
MSEEKHLYSDLADGLLTLIIDRPPVNAFSLDLIKQLQDAFLRAERDDRVRCVLLTGTGDVFSAGQDIHDFLEEDVPFRYHMLRTYNPLVIQIRRLEKPVLAALNGITAGAGLGIALACDLRIASDQAQLVVGFTGIGLVPDSAVSLLLPALIGLGRATEYTFFNTPIAAAEAQTLGLVNRVVPHGTLAEHATAWAAALAQGARRAFGLSKRLFNKSVLPNLEQLLDYEAYLQEIASHTPEHKEGVRAFLEKRPPKFTDL